MKTLLKFVFLFILGTTVFTSCKEKDNVEYSFNYGVTDLVDGEYIVVFDDGSKLVSSTGGSLVPTVTGQRVLVCYTVLDERVVDNRKIYRGQILDLQKILTKSPLYSSKLSQAQQDSVGHDKIDVANAWFGNKFLNFSVIAKHNDPRVSHMLNLVVLESESTDEKVVVELRHNAFGDGVNGNYQASKGLVAFDISKLIPEGKTSINVEFRYTNYAGEIKSDSGVFKSSFYLFTDDSDGAKPAVAPSGAFTSAKDVLK